MTASIKGISEAEADKMKELNFKEMLFMDSEKRLALFSKILGEEKAVWVNARFEQDLVLKNKKAGLLNWLNSNSDIKEKFRQEIIRRITKLDKVLKPIEEEMFLSQLAELAAGIGVTEEETKIIFDLSRKAEETKVNAELGGDIESYNKAHAALQQYVDGLKNS